ncbi:MAG: aspartate kinase [Candidatus Tokpelaia sp.]|nr:MAG: aspartate kinase [Candidatus Tokpelaia sp.]KAA6206222.1 MAG: aspartate kinase [Candidatus Tokpelaia sp.]
MARIVMKFGGTSVADSERIRNVARHVRREVQAGHHIAVVVSAMAGQTNRLIEWVYEAAARTAPAAVSAAEAAKSAAPKTAVKKKAAGAAAHNGGKRLSAKTAAHKAPGLDHAAGGGFQPYDWREYDAVVASGEQVTAGLLALALQAMGIKARSWAGWQIPVITDNRHGAARIVSLDAAALVQGFEQGQVAVIAGFQGVAEDGRIATLGRGGSDTSAVAMAAAIKADRCDIYTDVDGIYTTDPRLEPKARRLNRIAFEEMLEMASLGAKVMQVRSVELAMVHKVRTVVRCSFDKPNDPGQGDFDNPPGTLICDEEEILEQQVVTGIAFARDEAQISLRRLADRPGVSAAIFGPLAEAGVNVDMIVQNVSEDAERVDMTFTVPQVDLPKAVKVLQHNRKAIGYDVLQSEAELAKISVIGIGMRSHAGVAATAFKALAAKSINIRAITTSEIKISILIDNAYTELAVRSLHGIYGLDKI